MAKETQRFQLEMNLTKDQLELLYKFISDKDFELLFMRHINEFNNLFKIRSFNSFKKSTFDTKC